MAARQRLADDRRRRQFEVVLDIDGRYIQEAQTRDMRLRQNSVLREHDNHVVVDDGARQGHSRMQILDGYGFQSKFLLWETAYIIIAFLPYMNQFGIHPNTSSMLNSLQKSEILYRTGKFFPFCKKRLSTHSAELRRIPFRGFHAPRKSKAGFPPHPCPSEALCRSHPPAPRV